MIENYQKRGEEQFAKWCLGKWGGGQKEMLGKKQIECIRVVDVWGGGIMYNSEWFKSI